MRVKKDGARKKKEKLPQIRRWETEMLFQFVFVAKGEPFFEPRNTNIK